MDEGQLHSFYFFFIYQGSCLEIIEKTDGGGLVVEREGFFSNPDFIFSLNLSSEPLQHL